MYNSTIVAQNSTIISTGSFAGIPTLSGIFGYLEGCKLTYYGFNANYSYSFGNNGYSDNAGNRWHVGVFGQVNISNFTLYNWVINETITSTVNSVGFIGNAVGGIANAGTSTITIFNI